MPELIDTGSIIKTAYEGEPDTNAFTDALKNKLEGIEDGAEVNPSKASTSADGLMSKEDKSKLDGVASGDTANDTDSNLKDRANHTGSQTASTISDFSEAVDDRVAALLVEGTGIDITYNDSAGTLTIDATGGGSGGIDWSDAVDADIVPDAASTRSIGSETKPFAGGHFDALLVDGSPVLTEDTSELSEKSTLVDNDKIPIADSEASDAWKYAKRSTIRSGLTPTTRTVSSGTGLTGGGDLSADRTIALDSASIASLAKADAAAAALVSIVTKTAAHTLELSDVSKLVLMNVASAQQLTIPTNASVAFPAGTVLIVQQIGDGVTTVKGDTGVTVNGVSAGGVAITKKYGRVGIIKTGTNTWLIAGDIGTVE